MAKADLTAERLRELLHYDPETGIFRWREKSGLKVRVGDVAGFNAGKYRQIGIDGQQFYVHRLVWLYAYGEWPKHVIDHINGDRNDNRLFNLRDVPTFLNAQNQKPGRRKSASGLMGVKINRTATGTPSWIASLCVNGKSVHIGCYPTPEEAHQAYLAAKRKLHEGCTI